ncbi:MAG: hypothetical protein AAGI17_11080 [Planctomycetota bacterium]
MTATEATLFSNSPRARTPKDAPKPQNLRRDQVLERIVSLRPGINLDFLTAFTDESLALYLTRLENLGRPRGREARWTRPADAPAILTRPASSS